MPPHRTFALSLISVALFIILAGCTIKPAAPPVDGGDKAAGAKPGAATQTEQVQEYSLRTLCKKYVKENKTSNPDMTQEDTENMLLRCRMEATGREDKKNEEAERIYSEHILKTCEGKISDDWLKCYYAEVPNAHDKQNAKKRNSPAN